MRFLVVLAEAESEARQRIELPVEVPGLLRIILVGKHVGVQLHTEQYAVREKGIDEKTVKVDMSKRGKAARDGGFFVVTR